MVIKFVIPGEPVGKARARTVRCGRDLSQIRTYTPEKTRAYEDEVRWQYRACRGPHFGAQPVRISITAYMPVPKGFKRDQREQAASNMIRPVCKPDWDNIGKIICDALNGFAYQDDAQVVAAEVVKFYSDRPRVEVLIGPAGGQA